MIKKLLFSIIWLFCLFVGPGLVYRYFARTAGLLAALDNLSPDELDVLTPITEKWSVRLSLLCALTILFSGVCSVFAINVFKWIGATFGLLFIIFWFIRSGF